MVSLIKTEDEFNDIILNSKVVIDFYADWCGPCKMLSPIVEEVADMLNDVVFAKVNIDEVEILPRRYNVMSIPTLLVFEKGNLVKSNVGYIDKDDLLNFIKQILSFDRVFI